MADKKHILLTIGGDYSSAGLAAETWQNTLRFALVFGAVDPIGSFPDNFEPTSDTISRVETSWTIDGNWKVSGPGSSVFQVDDWLNDQVAPSMTNWMNTVGLSNGHRLQYLKAYIVGTDGKAVPAVPYASGTPITLQWTATRLTGPATQNLLPLQNSVVVSHRTAQIGRPGRGRMFRPALTAIATDGTGQLVSATINSVRDRQQAMLEAVKFSGVGVGAPQIRSCVTGSGFVNYATINAVRVGSVPDTQRRRRRALPETYVIKAVNNT